MKAVGFAEVYEVRRMRSLKGMCMFKVWVSCREDQKLETWEKKNRVSKCLEANAEVRTWEEPRI